jgi:cysteine desulfurase
MTHGPTRIYLDHAATTPVLAAARAACLTAMQDWANPSSPHADGRAAQARLEAARQRMAQLLDWEGEIIFTSGASEAIQIAITRAKANRRLVSPSEHDVLLRYAGEARRLQLNGQGAVVEHDLVKALRSGNGPALVAIQSVNNETGVMQDLAALGKVIRDHGGWLLADCAQSAGKLPLPAADIIALSAHKFGGPPGVGALLIRNLGKLHPSGGQEQGYRPGTQNLPYILAMVAALEEPLTWAERASELRLQLDRAIEQAGGEVIARDAPRLATIASYRMPGVPAQVQLIQFDSSGFSVSAGSACSSGTLKSSHVLSAMGVDTKAAGEVIRVSIGRDTSRADIYAFAERWRGICASMQR